MRCRSIAFSAVVLLSTIAINSTAASVWVLPIFDPLSNLANGDGSWALAESEAQKQHLPFLAMQVGSGKHYYYRGSSTQLNQFLAHCEETVHKMPAQSWYAEASGKVVIHPGPGTARIPGDKKTQPANWQLLQATDHEIIKKPHAIKRSARLVVHIWIDETIGLDELQIPDTFEVESGGEIERFIEKHREQQKADQ